VALEAFAAEVRGHPARHDGRAGPHRPPAQAARARVPL